MRSPEHAVSNRSVWFFAAASAVAIFPVVFLQDSAVWLNFTAVGIALCLMASGAFVYSKDRRRAKQRRQQGASQADHEPPSPT